MPKIFVLLRAQFTAAYYFITSQLKFPAVLFLFLSLLAFTWTRTDGPSEIKSPLTFYSHYPAVLRRQNCIWASENLHAGFFGGDRVPWSLSFGFMHRRTSGAFYFGDSDVDYFRMVKGTSSLLNHLRDSRI